jgi:arylsulfatase A-like enzyme
MKRQAALALILALFALAVCKKSPEAGLPFYSFVDILKSDNILESPFLGKSPADLTDAAYPVNSYPLQDAGSAENPLGLKRKHDLGSVENNILFAPPGSVYSFDVALPESGVLDFGIGIVRDNNSEALTGAPPKTGEGVEFIILLKIGGRSKTLFQEHLKIPPLRVERTVNFSRNKVALPQIRKKARLTFITAGKRDIFSFWNAPVLYSRAGTKPNVILVSIDTLRSDHLGIYGYARDTSPNMDALARDGVVFMKAYVSAPWTLPSHVSMMTGLDCRRHRVYYENDRMDPRQPTLAWILKENGYYCAAFTGAAFVSSFFGFSHGFNSYGMGQGDMRGSALAAEAGREATEWLDSNADKPFFLFVHTFQVHDPYVCPEPYNSMFLGKNPKWKKFDIVEDLGRRHNIFRRLTEDERQNVIGLYDGEIRYTDEALIKALIEKLKRLGIYDRTLLIITSDHGEEFYDHGAWAHTRALYDESIKVPLIIKFPGSRFRGQKLASIVRETDIVPTVLEGLGIGYDASLFDGRSLIPVITGKEIDDRVFTAELADNVVDCQIPFRVATNAGKNKLILNKEFGPDQLAFFIFPPPATPAIELYDLALDPQEKTNRADSPEKSVITRQLIPQASAIAQAMAKRGTGKAKMSKELEDQLRALGYIR